MYHFDVTLIQNVVYDFCSIRFFFCDPHMPIPAVKATHVRWYIVQKVAKSAVRMATDTTPLIPVIPLFSSKSKGTANQANGFSILFQILEMYYGGIETISIGGIYPFVEDWATV
jgi:hypothetical protein